MEPWENGQWEFAGKGFYKKGEKATFRNKKTGKEITLTGEDYNIARGSGTKDQFIIAMVQILNYGTKNPLVEYISDLNADANKLLLELKKMPMEEQLEHGIFALGLNKEKFAEYQNFLNEEGVEKAEDLSEEAYERFFGKPKQLGKEEAPLSPYVKYIEAMQKEQELAELGLLEAQTQAARESADIAAQQAMMQQSQFRDQIIEQIKSDRLNKMRQGMSPMQIANEELQTMVGGMKDNVQMMSQLNQQRLSAIQQERMNPYQAYINSQQAVTGQQGYINLAAGFDATRASSMNDVIRDLMITHGLTLEQAANLAGQRHINEKAPKNDKN
jgi:hypothetical protein